MNRTQSITVIKQRTACHPKSEGGLTMNRCWIAAAFGTAIALAGCAQTAQDENTDVYNGAAIRSM